MQQLKRVKLLGAAGREFGRYFDLAVKSPAEAVRALMALFPRFQAWVLAQHEKGVAWRVITEPGRSINPDELTLENTSDTIILAPVLAGSGGDGGFFSVILGVLLIAAAILIPGSALIFGTAWSSMSLSVGIIGASLLLGGISQLLTPTPKVNDVSNDSLTSNLFSRNQGTSGQGECIPVIYGRRRVRAPRVISFELRNLPASRTITTTGTAGLLGYVNRVNLT